MRELEAVLCYDQNLKHIVLSMFCLENSEYFLKIKGLDPVLLLQRTQDMIDTFATHHDKVSIRDSSLYAIQVVLIRTWIFVVSPIFPLHGTMCAYWTLI